MQPTSIRIIIQVLGSLIALLGISQLGFGAFLFLPAPFTSGAFGIAFGIFFILLAVYFIRIGYLVWFRWSPLAVRHVIGTLAFFLFGWLVRLVHTRPTGLHDWLFLWPLACFLAIYFLYRAAVAYCSRLLFPVSMPATVPQSRGT